MKFPAFETWLVRESGGDEFTLASLLTETLAQGGPEMTWALLEEASPEGIQNDTALKAARMILARAKADA